MAGAVYDPLEGAQEEVARSAGRVDHAEALQGPLGQGRLQGLIEDELLDELRGLQQGEGLPGVLGQVLVEVPQEAGGQVLIAEVPDEAPGLILLAPEGDDPAGHGAANGELAEGRM